MAHQDAGFVTKKSLAKILDGKAPSTLLEEEIVKLEEKAHSAILLSLSDTFWEKSPIKKLSLEFGWN